MPEISVIIPTRNRHKLLHRAIESVLHQTKRDFEIIVVDNNSDNEKVIDSPHFQPFRDIENVRVFRAPEATNAAQVRNVGLDHAIGKWITFLDDDDAYQIDKLECQYELAVRKNAPLVLCGLRYHLTGRKRVVQCRDSLYYRNNWIGKLHPATPTFFHKSNDRVRFQADLAAFEDFVYFYDLVKHFDLVTIENVPKPLIDVYPQPGPRVNQDYEAIWRGSRKIYCRMVKEGNREAASHFAIRCWISRQKFRKSSWIRFLCICLKYLNHYGYGYSRFVLQAVLYRIPVFRRFLVQ